MTSVSGNPLKPVILEGDRSLHTGEMEEKGVLSGGRSRGSKRHKNKGKEVDAWRWQLYVAQTLRRGAARIQLQARKGIVQKNLWI